MERSSVDVSENIALDHLNTDQNDSVSPKLRTAEHLRRTKTARNRRGSQGNNYGAHQARASHRGVHKGRSLSLVANTRKIAASSFSLNRTQTMTSMKSVVGLQNLGLTCYGNAVLQALRHVERVPWLLQNGRCDTLFQKETTSKRLLQQTLITSLIDMISQQETGQKGSVLRPAGFWHALRACVRNSVYDQFILTAPHDAHEFLMCLLETLHESTAMEVDMQIMKSAPSNPKEERIIKALETWKTEFSKQYSPFVDLFHGLLHVQITCLRCKTISHRWETFNTLKAVVNTQSDTLYLLPAIQKDLEGEDIEGYSCDTCSPERTIAHRSSSLWRLPQTFIVCLKRFTYDGRKIHTKVLSPQRIDVKALFSEESPEKDGNTEYTLCAIVDHHGGSGGGHYTAQCKDKLSQHWFMYDDESAYNLDEPKFGETNYMLFYERVKK